MPYHLHHHKPTSPPEECQEVLVSQQPINHPCHMLYPSHPSGMLCIARQCARLKSAESELIQELRAAELATQPKSGTTTSTPAHLKNARKYL
jgi:hypothetical protein